VDCEQELNAILKRIIERENPHTPFTLWAVGTHDFMEFLGGFTTLVDAYDTATEYREPNQSLYIVDARAQPFGILRYQRELSAA
jgi:hypothetical protein